MRSTCFGLCLLATVACKKPEPPVAPERAWHPQPTSTALADSDVLVRSIGGLDVGRVRTWMTPELRSRISSDELERASAQLQKAFGPSVGVLEERTHQEGELLWYSGVWIHRKPGRVPVVTPVLYQFALDKQRRLARLVIREHWFLDSMELPADHYQPVTRLHFPGRGEWTISHGGRGKSLNHHYKTRAQRFAYDIVMKKNGRRRKPNAPENQNSSYYCYGAEIVAPAAGTVTFAVNDVRENTPGVAGEKGGNGVVIDHGFGEFSSMWHAIPGTVRVKVGDQVVAGQVIALAGNSGHSSGPHLHYHLSAREAGTRKEFGLPAPFVDVWVDGRWHELMEPIRGTAVRLDPPSGVLRRDQAAGPRYFVDL
ncbi:MAG TPA: peptidoglycan DD-metalloendopeptidase family protein [Nannocystaceae bacterium]|nr:peptidoglycan DD-metalloendopeptidase family protein [Nannocystaceae bacterium]